ncbi:hypothetical protein UFOVP190_113 [uncultured Caudovirales phage]|uniref:Uncharacterized protein n=1 Tax=uncultured Caudovirales phage TaxID=2100421 RepID=A0A6J7WNY4_9CAUD|nr:hypothetical protein UFOVP190_113 [uncultured Caudovirales phage]
MSNNHPHDNIYSILGKLDALKPTPEEKRFALVKEIRESVEAQGSITEGVSSVEAKLRKQLAESKKAKPDYIDLDKDGNKKEPMKKAAKEKVKESAVANECAMCESGSCSVHGMAEGMLTHRDFEKPDDVDVMKMAKMAARGLLTYAAKTKMNPANLLKKDYYALAAMLEKVNPSLYATIDDQLSDNDYNWLYFKAAALAANAAAKQGVAEDADDLRSSVLSVIQNIYNGASAGKEMIDDVADELGQYFSQVKKCTDKPLRKAYQLMRREGAEAEGDPEYMAQVAKQAIDLLSQPAVAEDRTEVKDAEGRVKSWRDEGKWKKSEKKDPRGKVTNLSDKARRETEKLDVEEGEVKKIPGGVRHTKTDYPGYPTDDTLDNIDNLKGPGGGVRKGRPLKAQTKNPRRDPNAPKKGRGRPAAVKSGPVSMPADPFGRTTGRVPKGRKGTVHTVDEAMRIVARNLMIMEGVNFGRMIKEQHMTLDEMVECMNADMQVFKETGVCSDRLRDMMEVYAHAKRQADEGIEQPQQGGIGNDVVDKPHKMFLATPPMNTMDKVKDLGRNVAAFVRGKPEKPFEESGEKDFFHNPAFPDDKQLPATPKEIDLEEELNELARLAGLTTEATIKKADKDYDQDGEIESGKDEVIGSRRKAAGLDEEPGEKVRVGDKQYPVKEAQELVAMLKVAGINTDQFDEAIEQATQVRGIPVHKHVDGPYDPNWTPDDDEEGEVCPECDGAGCPECAFGDDSAVDRAHAHAQGMERESAGIDEDLQADSGQYYEDSADFFGMFDQDHFDEEKESDDGMEIRGYIDGKCVMAWRFNGPDMTDGYGAYDDSELVDETDLANAPDEKYDTIDATIRPGDGDLTGPHRNFGGKGDNLMAQRPNRPSLPVTTLEAKLAAEYESIKKASK